MSSTTPPTPDELASLPSAPGTACGGADASSHQRSSSSTSVHHGHACGEVPASAASALPSASSSSASSPRLSASSGPRHVEIEITSDITCPWCFVGMRRFRKALAEIDPTRTRVDVYYRPFSWDNVAAANDSSGREVRQLDHLRERHGAEKVEAMLQTITDAGRTENIVFNFDNKLGSNLLAHRLTMQVQRDHPTQILTWMDALFSAFFEHQLDVSSVDALSELAASSIGLNAAATRAFLQSHELEDEVKDEVARSRRKGLKSVPTFDFGGRLQINGAHEVKTFLTIFKRLGYL